MRLAVHKTVRCRLPMERLQSAAGAALRRHGKKLLFPELSLVIAGAAMMKRLNKTFRGKNALTDVLSFDYGEIIICYPLAKRQAREHGVSAAAEIVLLFVHGLLHILGFEHKSLRDRQKMARAEKQILGYSGLAGRTKV